MVTKEALSQSVVDSDDIVAKNVAPMVTAKTKNKFLIC